MSIEIQWLEDQDNILLWDFQGAWTLQDFRDGTDYTISIIDEVKRYDIILDMTHGITPRFPMVAFQRILKRPIIKRDLVVLVTNERFLLAAIQVLKKIKTPNLSSKRLAVVSSMDEALESIHLNRQAILMEEGQY